MQENMIKKKSDLDKYNVYLIDFIVLEVLRLLVLKLGIPYDVAERQFKESMTYQLLLNSALNIWQTNVGETYSKQAEFVLATYLHEQNIYKQFKEGLSKEKLVKLEQEEAFQEIKKLAIMEQISIEEAYYLKQLEQKKDGNIKQKRYQDK